MILLNIFSIDDGIVRALIHEILLVTRGFLAFGCHLECHYSVVQQLVLVLLVVC